MATVTQEGQPIEPTEKPRWQRVHLIDAFSLVTAGGIAAIFLLLPWFRGEPSAFVLMIEADGGLLFVLLGAVIAALAAAWALWKPAYTRFFAGLIALGGLVSLTYFGVFLLNTRTPEHTQLFAAGAGFWLILGAAAALVAQALFPRPALPPETHSDRAYLGVIRGPNAYFLEQVARWFGAKPLYLAVFANLALITIVEVVITELPNTQLPLIALSVVKVILVGMYYMHLKSDHWLFSAFVIVPLPFVLIIAVALIIGI